MNKLENNQQSQQLISINIETENIKIKPQVPKFDINRKPISQQNSDSEEIKGFCSTTIKKKKVKAIMEEIEKQIEQLSNKFPQFDIESIRIESSAKNLITTQFLTNVRHKKHENIAKAVIIHVIRLLYPPSLLKGILSDYKEKKHIKSILTILFNQTYHKLVKQVNSVINMICQKIGFNQKYAQFCQQLLQIIQKYDFIEGYHEQIIGVCLVKIIGDFIFWKKGGINLSSIAMKAKCCEKTVQKLLKKMQPYMNEIYKELNQLYTQNTMNE